MEPDQELATPTFVPKGNLLQLRVDQIRVNPSNPRRLFDPGPLADLKANIKNHGVLVPLTVYRVRGQDIYEILDGQRRFQCCEDLVAEGFEISVPANVVEPPTKVAGLLYMFNIHNYREQWELMPTALSLQVLIDDLGTSETRRLSNLTGLNVKNVERCKTLLGFPRKYQAMSLDPDPKTRIPSNFWIESAPVLALIRDHLPDLWGELGQERILDNFVEKYRRKRVRSVIDFRRIVEAYEIAENARLDVLDALRRFALDVDAEARQSFDHFVANNRRVDTAVRACRALVDVLSRTTLEHVVDDREVLLAELGSVVAKATDLIDALEGADAPAPSDVDLEDGA